MKVTRVTILLASELPSLKGMPPLTVASAVVTLDDSLTLHGVKVLDSTADNEKFVSFKNDSYSIILQELQDHIEAKVLLAYQNKLHPWICLEHEGPLHSLTLEILAGLREYYVSVDIQSAQQQVDEKVRKLTKKIKSWDMDDYQEIKAKVEPILQKIDKLINN